MVTVNVEIPKNYFKIPKEVINAKELSEHRISTLLYLHYNQTLESTVHYCPIYMISWCGYTPTWHRGAINNIYTKFRDSMEWYFKKGYLLDFDKDKYIQNKFQSSYLNKEKLLPEGNYGILNDFEINAIMKYEPTYRPLNRSILLLLLAYIKSYTWVRKFEISGHSEGSKKRKPEIFHSQFVTMGETIGVSPRLVSKGTYVLEELGFIKTYRMPSYQTEDNAWHTDDIIILSPYKITGYKKKLRICEKEEYDWEKELKYGIAYLHENGHKNKQFYQE